MVECDRALEVDFDAVTTGEEPPEMHLGVRVVLFKMMEIGSTILKLVACQKKQFQLKRRHNANSSDLCSGALEEMDRLYDVTLCFLGNLVCVVTVDALVQNPPKTRLCSCVALLSRLVVPKESLIQIPKAHSALFMQDTCVVQGAIKMSQWLSSQSP